MIVVTKKALILSADAKPYSFDGRSGTSYKCRVLVDGDIFPLKTDDEGVKVLEKLVGKETEINIKFSAPKENLRVEFVSVVTK